MNETSLKKTPISSKIGYSLGAAACCVGMSLPVFISYFMTESLAVPIITVSLMIVLVKIIDGFTDVIAGVIIDKTKSPKGKARPWFLRASIPYGICLALLFSVPADMGTAGKVAIVAILYALTVSVFGTLLNVARYALIPRMSKNPVDHGTYSILGDGILNMIIGLMMTVTLPLVGVLGWQLTYAIFGAVSIVLLLVCYALCKELPREEIDGAIQEQRERNSLRMLTKSLFSNKYALLLLIYVLVQQVAGGLIQLGGTYYFTYVLGRMDLFSLMMGISMVFGLIGLVASKFIVAKSSRLYGYSCLAGGILFLLVWAFGSSENIWFAVVGLALALLPATMLSMMSFGQMSAMTVEYGEWKSGVRAEGVTSSVVNVGLKIGTALGTALIGILMAAGGFIEGGVSQTASAIVTIKNSYLLVSGLILIVVGIFFFATWRLHKQMPQIRAELAQRHGEE